MAYPILWIHFLLWLGLITTQHRNLTGTSGQVISSDCQNMTLSLQSRLLDSALMQLKKSAQKGAWNKISPAVKSIRKGDSGRVVLTLRKCLEEQYHLNAVSNQVFDTQLERMVMLYQIHHGLTVDGIVGKATIRELNTPLSERIDMILANIPSAIKWSKNDFKRSIVINIPAFLLQANDSSGYGITYRVVVGKLENRTAEFNAQMEQVVFNPYWDIPESILQKEILPKMRRDPSFLKKNHMEWVGNRLRQKPGIDNALGFIKFIFPNPYQMYLHDTPAKELFKQDVRAFSHGCIRVEEPIQLAMFCLKGTDWERFDKIKQLKDSVKEMRIALKEKIPVKIVYMTAFVDQSGHLNFRHDLYKKRQKVLETAKKG